MKSVAILRELSVEELEDRIAKAKAELAKERATISSGTRAEKPGKIRNLRTGIARMFTIIKEKSMKTKKAEKGKIIKIIKK